MKVDGKRLRQALIKIKDICSTTENLKIRGVKNTIYLECTKQPYSVVAAIKLENKIKDFECVLPFANLIGVVKATGNFEFEMGDSFAFKQGNMKGNIPILPDYGFNISIQETQEIESNFLFDNINLFTLKDLKFTTGESDIFIESTGNTAKVYAANYGCACIADFKSNLNLDMKISVDTLRKLAKLSGKNKYELGYNENFIFAKTYIDGVTYIFNASLKADISATQEQIKDLVTREKAKSNCVFSTKSELILDFLNDCKATVDSNSVVDLTVEDKKVHLKVTTEKGNTSTELSKVKFKHSKNKEIQLSYDFLSDLLKKINNSKVKIMVGEKAIIIECKKPTVTYALGLV